MTLAPAWSARTRPLGWNTSRAVAAAMLQVGMRMRSIAIKFRVILKIDSLFFFHHFWFLGVASGVFS